MIRLLRTPDKSDHSLTRTVFPFTFNKKLRLTRTFEIRIDKIINFEYLTKLKLFLQSVGFC